MNNPLTERIQALQTEQKILLEHGSRLDEERGRVATAIIENRGALKELQGLLQILKERKHGPSSV